MARPRTVLRKTGTSVLAALLLLSTGAALPCPPMCRLCSVYAAECEQVSSLTDVLVGLSSFTEKILLQNGNLTVIPPMSFTKFSNLHILTITGFLLLSLTDLTFSTTHVNSLRILDLSSNHLFSCLIEPMAFSGLLFLEELILTNNSLDLLRSSWFSEMPVLRKLFLGVNTIGYLPPRTFERLANLDELVVHTNFIQYLPIDTFYGLSLLTKLDLSGNKILFINHEVFQPLQALKDLLLFQNMLTILPIIPGSITFLFLHDNPWECNCQLLNSVEPLIAKIQSPAGVICNRPPSLAGRQVVNIRLESCMLPSSSLLPSSSSAAHLPPLNALDVSFIYGLLGGFLLTFLPTLLCCCCFMKYGCCTHCRNQTEDEQPFLNKLAGVFSSKRRNVHVEPQVCCSFPVVGNVPMGSDMGDMARGNCCGCVSETSRECNMGHTRTAFQRPLVAHFSTDATGRTAVTLQERGSRATCPALGQPCCQTHRGSSSWKCKCPGCSETCGSRDQRFAKADHGSGGLCLQQTASNQMERTARGEWRVQNEKPSKNRGTSCSVCAVPQRISLASTDQTDETVGRKHIDTQLDKQTLHPDMQPGDIQNPPTLVHVDFPDETALKIEKERSRAYRISSKRKDSHQGCSVIQRSMLSPGRLGHHHQAGLMSPRDTKGSEARRWQEGFMERRRPKHTTRSGRSSWKTDLYSKYYPMLAGQTNKIQQWNQLCDQGPLPTSDVPSTSPSMPSPTEDNDLSPPKEPYVDMLPVAHLSGKRKRSSQQLDDAPIVGRMALENAVAQSSHQYSDISLTRRVWKCPRCGCKESNPYLIAQRVFAQQNPIPKASGKQLDVATQWPSSDTVLHKECNVALTVLGLHHNVKKSLLEDLWPSCLSELQPPFAVSHHERNEDVDSAYEYPFPLVGATSVGPVLPLTGKTRTQLILRDQDQRVGVMETLESKTVVDHSVDTYPPNTLSEEMLDAEASSEGLTTDLVDQHFVEDEKDAVGSSSNVTHLTDRSNVSNSLLFKIDTNSSLLKSLTSDGSCTEVTYSGDLEDAYDDVATITSSYPLIEKMCQIDFPLQGEEEKPSKWNENKEDKNRDDGPA